MNIIKKELKMGLRSLIIWLIVMGILIYASMVKFTGISAGGQAMDFNKMLSEYPKSVLAVFGMSGVDISSIQGYYSVVIYYVMICMAVFAGMLGAAAITREDIDKTTEFLFTKPRCRCFILAMKMIYVFLSVSIFTIMCVVSSIAAFKTLKLGNDMDKEIWLYGLAIFLIGILFVTLGAFAASVCRNSEKGNIYASATVLVAFILGVVYDMTDSAAWIRVISPFKYFTFLDVENGRLKYLYVIILLIVSVLLESFTFMSYNKKEL